MLITIDVNAPDEIKNFPFKGTKMIVPLDNLSVLAVDDEGNQIAISVICGSKLNAVIQSNALPAKMIKMREMTPWSFVLIDIKSVDEYAKSSILSPVIQGAMRAIQELGVMTSFDEDAAQSINAILDRKRTPKKVLPAREATLASDGEIFLASLPGIGIETASLISELYDGNIAIALADMTNPDIKLTGIAESKRKAIRECLKLGDDLILAVDSTIKILEY